MKSSHLLCLAVLLVGSTSSFAQSGLPTVPYAAPGCYLAPVGGPNFASCPPPCPVEAESCFSGLSYWFGPEYLYWRPRAAVLPTALVTTSQAGTGAGLPGDSDSLDALSEGSIDAKWQAGLRFSAGVCDTMSGMCCEGSVFGFADADNLEVLSSSTSAVLARPFVNSEDGQDSVFLVASPGAFSGQISVASFQRLRGADGHVGCHLCGEEGCSIDLLVGARYLQLHEGLTIGDSTTALADGIAFFLGQEINAGDVRTRFDRFDARNEFYGPQIGFRAEACSGPLYVKLKGLVAIGKTVSDLNVRGDSALIQGGVVTQQAAGGLLALPSNTGRFRTDDIIAVPQIEASIGLDLGETVRIFAGYSYLYWRDVVRPGEQLPATVNPALVPTSPTFGAGGSTFPLQPNISSAFWVHGLHAGLAVRF